MDETLTRDDACLSVTMEILPGRYGWPFQKETADPVTLRLTDENDIIAGFREGVLGMREGGKRRLVIPKGTYQTVSDMGRPQAECLLWLAAE